MSSFCRRFATAEAPLDQVPFDAATGLRSHQLTAASSSISLAPGAYIATLDGSIAAVLRLGAAAAAPTPDAAEIAGSFYLPAGGAAGFVIEGAADVALHGLLLSAGTSNLYLMRVQ